METEEATRLLTEFIAFLEEKGIGAYTPERRDPVRFDHFPSGSLEEEFLASRALPSTRADVG